MKIKVLSFFFGLWLLNISFCFAQGPQLNEKFKATITGKVIDVATKAPLDYAAVSLFNQKDSLLVAGNVTDIDGKFTIEANPGNYYIKIEFLSYKTRILPGIVLENNRSHIDLGEIILAPAATMLNEVEVIAEKSQMQMSLDKRIFNVGKDLANSGGNAADLLDNVPSVVVDIEGTVSLRGSENVRILVDGKPSTLIGLGNSNGLRNLPASMIESVEVITNPSARYEAEGMSGIINIVMKKQRKSGLNGAFDVTLGYPENYGAAANLNYRTNKMNFFANYGLNYRSNPGTGRLFQEIYQGDTTFLLQQSNDSERGGLSNSIRLGGEYLFNDKNSLTASFLYRHSDNDNNSKVHYRDFINSLDNPTSYTLRSQEEQEVEPNTEFSLDYRKTFEKKDHELKASFQYRESSEDVSADFSETFFDADEAPLNLPNLLQRSVNVEGQNSLLFQMDYVQPFSEEGKFELGLRSSLREINNDYLIEEFQNNDWTNLVGLSNNFIYNENIHAAYAIYGNKVAKWSYQFGLRTEYSDVSTHLLQTNEINDRNYTTLFPSAFLTYEFNDGNALQTSYSRRMRRPRFRDLNPFFTFRDSRNLFGGNPNLDPELTDSYEMTYLKYWEKATISAAIYYRHTNDKIERIRIVNEDGTSNTMPQNLTEEDAFGAEFTYSLDLMKGWNLNGDFNFFRAITDGGNLGESFQSDTYTLFGRVNTKFTVFKDIDFQLRFNYRAPRETTQGKNKSTYSLDLGASKDILGKKGTLTLSARDLLNSRKRRYINFGDNFYSEGEHQWRSRQIRLTLSYRLNQQKRRSRRDTDRGDFEGEDMY